MNHRFLEDRIFLYIDRGLPAEELARCEEHLRTCPRCRERVTTLRAAWGSETLLSVPGPALRLRTRVEAALRGEDLTDPGPTVTSRLAGFARPALMAASLAVGIMFGTYLGSGPNGDTAQLDSLSMESNELAFSFAEDLQEISAESVGQEYLLLDWDEPVEDPGR